MGIQELSLGVDDLVRAGKLKLKTDASLSVRRLDQALDADPIGTDVAPLREVRYPGDIFVQIDIESRTLSYSLVGHRHRRLRCRGRAAAAHRRTLERARAIARKPTTASGNVVHAGGTIR